MKRTPIRKVSAKRQLENIEREKVLVGHYGPRSGWVCVLKGNEMATLALGPCWGPVNAHEIVKSSQGGSRTDVSNILPVCNRHNTAIEDNPDEAHKLGLMKHRWEA